MRKFASYVIIALLSLALASACFAQTTAAQILDRVKAAEAGFNDFKADMAITEADKSNVGGMGENYEQILRLKRSVVSFKKPDKIRYDGYAEGIKATYIQNGYVKQFTASMIKHKENVKNAPGKRQDTLDLGFLSSRLWVDNNVTVAGTESSGAVKLKFDPKSGDNDKRHDMVWVDSKTLRVIKREKYRGSGELRIRMVYSDYQTLGGKLSIATTSTMYNNKGKLLGTVEYKNLKVNVGLADSLFAL